MIHDPACDGYTITPRAGWHCHCGLIARVRAEERENAAQRVADLDDALTPAGRVKYGLFLKRAVAAAAGQITPFPHNRSDMLKLAWAARKSNYLGD